MFAPCPHVTMPTCPLAQALVPVPTRPLAASPLWPTGQLINRSTIIASHPRFASHYLPHQTMREIPPDDEKPKRNWLGMGSKPPSRPAPKPDPKPKPKPDPKPRHTAERERRQVKLAQNARSHTPSEPAKKSKKDDSDGCGCLILIGVVIAAWYFFFR